MKKKKNRTSKQRVFPIWLGILILLFVAASIIYLIPYETSKKVTIKSEEHKETSIAGKHKETSTTGEHKKGVAEKHKETSIAKKIKKRIIITPGIKKKKNQVAIVIDDIGYDSTALDKLLKLKSSLTLSILPHCPCSVEAAKRAHRKGKEVLLHLPMEPYGYPEKNSGEGTLFVAMNNSEIKNQLEKDIKAVPYTSGVNNHMGSRFMENETKLEVVLKCLKDRNLFFLDSYTTSKSKGKVVANKIGIKFTLRDVFIDNDHDLDATCEIFKDLIEKRETWDSLVLIGHPYNSTIEAIEKTLPHFKANAIEIVPLSHLITKKTTCEEQQ